MEGFSGLRTTRRPRRIIIGLGACALVLSMASVAGAEVPIDTPAPVRQAVIESPTHLWKPSVNARLRTVPIADGQLAGQVEPRRSKGRKSISIRNSSSTISVPNQGSRVRVTTRLKTSQPGRRLQLRVIELNGGRYVGSRSVSIRPSSSGWRELTVGLTTRRSGSKLLLLAKAKRVTHRNFLRVSTVDVAVALPGDPMDPPPVDPPPVDPPPVDPPPATPVACKDLNYSDPAQGRLTFADEFTGTKADGTGLDLSKWRVRDNTFLNQDQAWISKDNVSVHPSAGTDGVLDIAGRKLASSDYKSNPQALYPGENTKRDYSTGYVDSIDSAGYGNAAGNRFGQKYGYYEVRAWVPSEATMSRGIWPAFWLRADHQVGEIDPMESYGAPTIRSYDPSSSYEWNSWADTAQGSMSGIDKQQTHGRADVGTDKIWQGWHRYAVNWSPKCLRYLYDGRTVGFVDFTDPATRTYFTGPSFDDTFHIRLNMQIGSKYWGWADDAHTRKDFHFKIDYVRVYQGTGDYAPR